MSIRPPTMKALSAGVAPVAPRFTELLIPGDSVTISDEDTRVYEIVHISNRKAWVRSVPQGRQRIVASSDLMLSTGEHVVVATPSTSSFGVAEPRESPKFRLC